MENKPIYIASDMHLGAPPAADSRQRERLLVQWLDYAAHDAGEIILLGDVFDFWFEWKHVVPKGFVRLLGKLAQLTDMGTPITVFAGNHDMWYRDYLAAECGVKIVMHHQARTFFGKRYYLHHGDGKGPGDHGFKWMKRGMRSRVLNWVFARLHPNLSMGLAKYLSKTSRNANRKMDDQDHGQREFLVQYVARKVAQGCPFDYYVFGHRHMARQQRFGQHATLLVLGDWITDFSYLRINENGPQQMVFRGGEPKPSHNVVVVGACPLPLPMHGPLALPAASPGRGTTT